MARKYRYLISILIILVVLVVLFYAVLLPSLPAGKGYWVGNYPSCYSVDQCECGAKGYMETKTLGSITIPYSFISCPYALSGRTK